MQEWKKNIRQVVPYVPGEQPKKANVIQLNTNENPYPPSPKVKEQCAKICAETEELRLYPDPTAGMLVEAIAKYKGLDSSQIFVGVGSDDVHFLIANSRYFSRISLTHFMMFGLIYSRFHMIKSHQMRTL